MKTTLSLSGGKDSTFLLLELIRRGTPPDECVFFDTGWEFPQMYRHMDRLRALCEENGIEFTVLPPAKSFGYLMFEKPVKEKNGRHALRLLVVRSSRRQMGNNRKGQGARPAQQGQHRPHRHRGRRARSTRERAGAGQNLPTRRVGHH